MFTGLDTSRASFSREVVILQIIHWEAVRFQGMLWEKLWGLPKVLVKLPFSLRLQQKEMLAQPFGQANPAESEKCKSPQFWCCRLRTACPRLRPSHFLRAVTNHFSQFFWLRYIHQR